MKRYSDLQAISNLLSVTIELEPIGQPSVAILINDNRIDYTPLTDNIILTDFCDLLSPIIIEVELKDKQYTTEFETAVVIKQISIDNINVIPEYNHLTDYQNDRNNNPTNYLGFNGKWTLTIDRPFYQWLHQAQSQGWLLSP